jgi:hypothetical protein
LKRAAFEKNFQSIYPSRRNGNFTTIEAGQKMIAVAHRRDAVAQDAVSRREGIRYGIETASAAGA